MPEMPTSAHQCAVPIFKHIARLPVQRIVAKLNAFARGLKRRHVHAVQRAQTHASIPVATPSQFQNVVVKFNNHHLPRYHPGEYVWYAVFAEPDCLS